MPLIDLSPRIDASTRHWPGDQPFSAVSRWSLAAGDAVTVATITGSGHLGAHIDAPSHVDADGASVEQTPLESCIGSCLLVDVAELVDRRTEPHGFAPAARVRARIAELAAAPVERLLLRHRSAADPVSGRAWDPSTPGVDPELVRWFGAQGGLLIGLDLDSFDPERSTALTAHRAAVEAGIVMLEGLDLSAAPEGSAELFAQPVAWSGVDAAPVRAVLRIPG